MPPKGKKGAKNEDKKGDKKDKKDEKKDKKDEKKGNEKGADQGAEKGEKGATKKRKSSNTDKGKKRKSSRSSKRRSKRRSTKTKPVEKPEVVEIVLDEEELSKIKSVFSYYDEDKNGLLNWGNLRHALYALRYIPTDAEVEMALEEHEMEKGADCRVSYETLCDMLPAFPNVATRIRRLKGELMSAFQVLDEEEEKELSHLQFREMMRDYGDFMSDKEIDQMVRDADCYGSGMLPYEVFIDNMLYRLDTPLELKFA